MKSLQIRERPGAQKSDYSELSVCQSAAGFYIGTMHYSPSGDVEPGSRDTDYFATKEDAAFALSVLERMWAERMRVRAKYPGHFIGDDEEFSTDFAVMLMACGLDPFGVGLRLRP